MVGADVTALHHNRKRLEGWILQRITMRGRVWRVRCHIKGEGEDSGDGFPSGKRGRSTGRILQCGTTWERMLGADAAVQRG